MSLPKLVNPVMNERCLIISTVVITRSMCQTTIQAVSNPDQAPLGEEQGYFVVVTRTHEDWFTEMRWTQKETKQTSAWVNSRQMNILMVSTIAGEWEALRM